MFALKKGERCPACQKGSLEEKSKDFIFKYKNKAKKFKDEKVFRCDVCGFEGLTKKLSGKIERELTDFRRKIDGLLVGKQLEVIRKNLRINKKQMAELLSVNEKTVGRYENGKITQSTQIDKLYRIFQVFPSAVTEMNKRTLDVNYSIQPPPARKFQLISSGDGVNVPKETAVSSIDSTYLIWRPKDQDLQAA